MSSAARTARNVSRYNLTSACVPGNYPINQSPVSRTNVKAWLMLCMFLFRWYVSFLYSPNLNLYKQFQFLTIYKTNSPKLVITREFNVYVNISHSPLANLLFCYHYNVMHQNCLSISEQKLSTTQTK